MASYSDMDIRDVEPGMVYWVVTDSRTGRCIKNDMFIAVFPSRQQAACAAAGLGSDYVPVKQLREATDESK